MNNIPNPDSDFPVEVSRFDEEMFGKGGLIPDHNGGRNRNNPSKTVRFVLETAFALSLVLGSGAIDVQAKSPYNPASAENNVKIDGYDEWLARGGDGTPFKYAEWARQVGKTDEEIQLGLEVAMQRFQESDDWLLYNWSVLTMLPADKESFDRIHSSRQGGVDQELGIETKVIVSKYYDQGLGKWFYRELVFARRFVDESQSD